MSRRGIDRERQVRRRMEAQGFWTCRAAGSFGDADVVGCRYVPAVYTDGDADVLRPARTEVWFVEVKSTAAGPYHGFGPKDRLELMQAAELAGAHAWLCWWPPRKLPVWIPAEEWPPIPKRLAA